MYRTAEATISDIKNKSIEKRSHFLKSNQSRFLAAAVKEYLNMFTLENILTGKIDCVNTQAHLRAIPAPLVTGILLALSVSALHLLACSVVKEIFSLTVLIFIYLFLE